MKDKIFEFVELLKDFTLYILMSLDYYAVYFILSIVFIVIYFIFFSNMLDFSYLYNNSQVITRWLRWNTFTRIY